jgi:signal transduction histidine kinase
MRFWLPGFGQLRTRLLYLVLVALAPACGLVLYGNFELLKVEKDGLRAQAISTAELAAASQEHFIKNARHLLGTLRDINWLMTAPNRSAVEFHFINLRLLSPDYADFGLVEADGRIFASAADTNTTQVVTNWSLFRKCLATERFCVSNFEPDEVAKTETVRFGYPVVGSDGKLLRILYGSLRLPLLSEVLTNISLPTGSTITVVDPAGNVVARYPDGEKWVGKNLAKSDYVRSVLDKREETTFESTGLDGEKRLFATSSVSDGKGAAFFVAVGIPTGVLYAQANEKLWRKSLALMLVGLVAFSAAWLLGQKSLIEPVNQIAGAARRLAAGDYAARAKLGDGASELHQLAKDFDAMAENLARREADLRAASEKISKLNAELENRVVERTKQLEASNRELEAFSYSVSHDLRAPLRHMDGFAQILMTEPSVEKDERAKRYLQLITKAAKQMGMLIDDLLSFSKMGRQSMVKQRVNMEALVEDVIKDFREELEERRVEWRIEKMPLVEGDATMLRQVWVNLVSNALKYTRERPVAKIDIGAREEPTEQGDEVVFLIKDNGAGFEMKYADKLFGVFQRLHKAEEFEGTGIGLANVRRIVARHFGRTWAEGELDKGATVYFSLPKRRVFESEAAKNAPGEKSSNA